METNINANVETSLSTEHVLDVSDRLYKVFIAAIAVGGVALAGWALYAYNALPQNMPHEITVSGNGKAYAKPDVATISFGAHTEAAKSQDAVAQNNKIMDGVILAIKALGVEDKDIQTTMYNVQPTYGYQVMPMRVLSYPVPPVQGNIVTGYSLDQQIEVKIHSFDNINAIFDVATKNGANTIGSLQFTVDDMEKVRSEARGNAIKQAKEKAGGMFSAAGLSGAKIVNIAEGYNGGYAQPMYATAMDKSASAPSANIQTGQMEIDTTVTLTYRVK